MFLSITIWVSFWKALKAGVLEVPAWWIMNLIICRWLNISFELCCNNSSVRPCIVLNWEHISNTIFIQASNVTQFPISPTLFIMNLKYDIKMQYFLSVREIVSAYLYSLALVHFNNVEVKAVDSFPGTKKDGVQREIVSYVDKNLQKRFFRGIRHDSTHNDNEISDQAYSSVNYVCLWCKNLKQRPWKNISEITKGSRNEIRMHSCLQLEFSGIILLLSSENNTVMLISPSHGHADHHSTLIWWCDAPCTIANAGQSINHRGIFTRAKDRDWIWSSIFTAQRHQTCIYMWIIRAVSSDYHRNCCFSWIKHKTNIFIFSKYWWVKLKIHETWVFQINFQHMQWLNQHC